MINEHLYPGQVKFGIIKKDAEHSKHLETAAIKVHDKFIDLVNLRAEEYTEGSNIPVNTWMGTPLEDAEWWDLTINAMFYNIQEGKLEDYTGKGFEDLKEGIARTPLEPYKTFKDDPLRILRTIRFASRFDLKVAPEIEETL